MLLRPATLLKKESLEQVFSSEFCENSKNNFFHRTPLVTASEVANSYIVKKNKSCLSYSTFSYSKQIMETPKQCVKSVQS